ncbi:MAG: hypothetical protein RMA76_36895 [Deltaproteobacteria bacterium]|jgi:hypothetical protein
MFRGAIPPPALLFGFLIGSALGFFVHVVFTGFPASNLIPLRVAETIELAAPTMSPAPPRAVHVGAGITPEAGVEARKALAAARASVKSLDGNAGVEAFEECIRQADLPACHLELGLVLLTAGDGAAYPHLRRYLELEPKPQEAALIRTVLDRVGTSTTS